MRFYLGFMLAPLGTIPAVFGVTIVGSLLAFGETADWLDTLIGAAYLSVPATIVAYGVMFTLGLAAVWLSRVYGWTSAKQYAILGFSVGVLFFALYFSYALIMDGTGRNGFDWNYVSETVTRQAVWSMIWMLYGGVSGLCSALWFWYLVWRVPVSEQAKMRTDP